MTLKEEIDAIINQKQAALLKKNAESNIAHDRRIEKFAPMIALLKDIVASIDPQYIQAGYYSFQASISIGRLRDGHFNCMTRWEISGRREIKMRTLEFFDLDGYTIHEESYYDEDPFLIELHTNYPDESSVANYLINEISDYVAQNTV
jgi:hypothetical protein